MKDENKMALHPSSFILHPSTQHSPTMMKERKSFLLRMDPILYEALEAWAQQELRSLNGQIEYLLKEAVAKHRRASADTDRNQGRKGEGKK
jgi:hypothetical protein